MTFAVADACTDPVPAADLVTVRQVLQHLTNQQIEMALKSIERSGSKYALVSEHCYLPEKVEQPNIDLPHTSLAVRAFQRSGVFINEPPFSRSAQLVKAIPMENPTERLCFFFWEIQP